MREIPMFLFEIKGMPIEIRVDTNTLIVICVLLNKNKKEDNLQDPHQTEAVIYIVEYLFIC